MESQNRYIAVGLYEPTNRVLIIEVGIPGEARDSVILKAYDRRNREKGGYKILGACLPSTLKQYGLSQYDIDSWTAHEMANRRTSPARTE